MGERIEPYDDALDACAPPCASWPSPLLPEPTNLSRRQWALPTRCSRGEGPFTLGARMTVVYLLFFTGRRSTSLIPRGVPSGEYRVGGCSTMRLSYGFGELVPHPLRRSLLERVLGPQPIPLA